MTAFYRPIVANRLKPNPGLKDGRLPALCWCQRHVVQIPKADVGVKTASCNEPGCVAPC